MDRKVLKHAMIVVASLALGFVTGFIAAFLTSPFWGWFEDTTGIESLGHSGPADWVLLLLFGLCTGAWVLFLERMFRGRKEQSASGR